MSIRAKCYRRFHDAYFALKGFPLPGFMKELEKSQWWSAEQLAELQNSRLRALIEYSYQYVPYYRRIMCALRLTPSDVQTTADLVKLPILSKRTFIMHRSELISTYPSQARIDKRQTGGSTGEPVQILVDFISGAYEGAAFYRGLGFAGYKCGDPLIRLFGGSLGIAPPGWISRAKAAFAGETLLSAFEVGPQNLRYYVNTIHKSSSAYLHGYSSAIFLLAQLMEQHQIVAPLMGLFPTSENLYDFQREAMEKAFQCRAFNQYGCCELNSIAFECEAHAGLHVTDENVYLEAINADLPAPIGSMGSLTMTTLHNFSMPLIRFQNGDMISLDNKPCSCGRGLSRIGSLYGRANDLLLAKDGRFVSASFIPYIFKTTEGINEMQVLQNSRDRIVLNIVKGKDYSQDDLDQRIDVLKLYLGDITVDTNFVDSIPRTPQGKLRSVVSIFGHELLSH